jgi:hypothetical protein
MKRGGPLGNARFPGTDGTRGPSCCVQPGIPGKEGALLRNRAIS